MHHRYLLLMLVVLLFSVSQVAVVAYDDTLTVSFDGSIDSSPAESYTNGSSVIIPYGITLWIGAIQYPGGRWEVMVPNLYPMKSSWKEIILLNFGNVQGLYSVTYHVPSVYSLNGALKTITLNPNVGDVGGDSYEDSIYAKHPNPYTLIFSDAYLVLQDGKTKGLFRFGNP